MRIAYVLDAFPVLSETFIVREILELRRRGLDVSVFALGDQSRRYSETIVHSESASLWKDVLYPRDIRARFSTLLQLFLHTACFATHPIKYCKLFWLCYRRGRRPFTQFRRSVVYAKLLKDQDVHHIHAHFSLNACTLSMLVSTWSGIPFSFTVHAHDIFIPDLADLMEQKLRSAKFVAAISEFNKRHLLERYPSIDADKIKVIHCGIDLAMFTPRKAPANRRLKILAVGRLHEQKGFEFLIRACSLLKGQHRLDFECEIVGDGEERVTLDKLVAQMDVGNVVRLVGAVDQCQVTNALAAADVFVLPCVAAKNGAMDGIPVALMEAMAMEIPVISTRISGIPELIGSEAGTIVEPQNFKDLSEAILRFAALSGANRREIGRRGRTVIEARFNLEIEVGRLSAEFQQDTACFLDLPISNERCEITQTGDKLDHRP